MEMYTNLCMKSPHDLVRRASFNYKTWRRGWAKRYGIIFPPEDRGLFNELRCTRVDKSRKLKRRLRRDLRLLQIDYYQRNKTGQFSNIQSIQLT